MKVRELIEELEKYDGDHDVVFDMDLGIEDVDDIVYVSEVYEGSNWNVVLTTLKERKEIK